MVVFFDSQFDLILHCRCSRVKSKHIFGIDEAVRKNICDNLYVKSFMKGHEDVCLNAAKYSHITRIPNICFDREESKVFKSRNCYQNVQTLILPLF